MKTFRLIAAAFFISAFFAISAFAQAAQPTATGKIVYINVAAFDDDKGGITKYNNAMNALDAEFKTPASEINAMITQYQALGKEIQVLQDQAKVGKVPISEDAARAKVDQYQKMERDIKFKQEDLKAKQESRYAIVVGPVMQDIGKAMQDFAKQKGYSMILDAAKLDQAGVILAIGNDSADVTKDFITFFNARPATTASTAAPK